MTDTSPISGERSNSKVAAVFADDAKARDAARLVGAALSLQPAQVQVIAPGGPLPGRMLEPESRGIWRTIVVAHLRLGLAGAAAGLVVFLVLRAMGLALIVNSPLAASLSLLFFGTVAGLMLGGLVALRPDHDRYVEATREAMARGMTTVLVHAFSAEQREQAADLLREQGGDTTSTL